MEGVLIPAILIIAEAAVRLGLLVVILLRKRGDSMARLAWLMVIILLPLIGTIAFLLMGHAQLGSRRMKRHERVVKLMSRKHAERPPAHPPLQVHIAPPFEQIATLVESVGGAAPLAGNGIRLFGQSDETLNAIIADIDAATEHVHLLTYIYLCDSTGYRVAEALIRAEKRGVQCRLLVDAQGSKYFLRSDLPRTLTDAGVQVQAALPVNLLRALFARIDLRNHRKITVIDGRIGYTGSQNIAAPTFAMKKRCSPYVDAMARITGPLVHDLQLLFVEDWFLDTDEWLEETLIRPEPLSDGPVVGQVIGTGPNAYNFAVRAVYDAAIHLAREEILLTTPYFVPDEATLAALMTAARRGVTTEIVLPHRNDVRLVSAASKSYYEPLLEAGARIYEFRAGMLHSKTLTVDRQLALVTSANLDRRSIFLNFEAGLIVYDDDFAGQLRLLQKRYIDQSTAVDAARWMRRRWPKRLVHNVAGMLSPLL